MDLSAINPLLFVAGFLVAATPLIFAAIGELVVEKSGTLNLGVEGMMIIGAICGFATAVETGSPCWALLPQLSGAHCSACCLPFSLRLRWRTKWPPALR
ncbi:hypothetical protein ACFQDZ_16480 [Sulfitobacter pacificus]|uniref:ABC transporter permease subunit n=1 Tax=Sulfitobacter pacificus TaxID=1499314 RepID=UPI003607C3B7